MAPAGKGGLRARRAAGGGLAGDLPRAPAWSQAGLRPPPRGSSSVAQGVMLGPWTCVHA